MKSNHNINMTNGVVKAGEFSYVRKARTIKAYEKEYEIPVKTVEFGDKLDEIREELSKTTKTSGTISIIKRGIALFIGKDEVERIYPESEIQNVDVDEILGFWSALNYELNRNQSELLSRYTASPTIRR